MKYFRVLFGTLECLIEGRVGINGINELTEQSTIQKIHVNQLLFVNRDK